MKPRITTAEALQEEPQLAAALALLDVVPQARLGQEVKAERHERHEREEHQDFKPRRLPQTRMHSANVLLEEPWPNAQGRGGQVLDNKRAEYQAAGGVGPPDPQQVPALAGSVGGDLLGLRRFRGMAAAPASSRRG